MPLPLELGAVSDPEARRALERVSAQWPTARRAVTTALRPNAARVPAGTMIYDTTLHRPVWSDGTTWRDATGTAA